MEPDLNEWKERLLALSLKGKFAGILHTINDSLADVVQSDRTDILYGQDYFYEELLGLKFRISTFSFFQTNSLGAEVLYDTARSYVGETKDQVIFDLYSGTGTIAQILAPVAKKVIGVEIVEEAVKAAGENAKLNGLTNCEFLAGDVLKMLDTIEERPDFIVLDPPRDGINPKALRKIINYGVERMVYISCKPTSPGKRSGDAAGEWLPFGKSLLRGYVPVVSQCRDSGTAGEVKFYFSRCQISRLYSAMVRSLENIPAFAMLIRHLRRHPIGSQA